MTRDELVEYAKRRLTPVNPEWARKEMEIAAAIRSALRLLANIVMQDDMKRVHLQQDYSLALDGNGRGALSSATASIAGDILPEGIYWGRVVDADGNVLWPLKNYQTFLSPQPTFKGYYGLFDSQVYTRASGLQVFGPQDVQGVSGPLTITANFTPANVDDVPAAIAKDLIDAVVEVAMRAGTTSA